MPTISGTVYDDAGAPAAGRIVRAYRRDTGALLGSTVTSDGASIPGDENYNSVSLLLHFEGANGSTAFVDSSPRPKTVTAFGSPAPTLSTVEAKFGAASLIANPTGSHISSGVGVASSTDFEFGTGDFTVEWWQYWVSLSTPAYQAAIQSGYNVNGGFTLVTDNADGRYVLVLGSAGTQVLKESSAGPVNAWTHYALTRVGNAFTLWRNGVASATGSSALSVGAAGKTFAIGCYAQDSGALGQVFNGYIDELRVTKGVARYTANFTPPTAPHYDRLPADAPVGSYGITTAYTGEVQRIVLDDDAGTLYNDLIDRVMLA